MSSKETKKKSLEKASTSSQMVQVNILTSAWLLQSLPMHMEIWRLADEKGVLGNGSKKAFGPKQA